MPTSVAGNRGFTLLELLVVIAIIALATAGVGFSLRDTAADQLEKEAQRLGALLDSARAQSRMTANPIGWRPTQSGFVFEGAVPANFPEKWLGSDVIATIAQPIVLGPEPIIGPQQIELASRAQPALVLTLATDGVHPFTVSSGDRAAQRAP